MKRKKKPTSNNIKIDSPEFKKLKAEWYKRMKDEGFIDIEYAEGPIVDQMLKFKSSGVLKNKLGKSIYEYYFLLRNFLTHNPDYVKYQGLIGEINKRFIVEKYTEGYSYREIANLSKKLLVPFSYFAAFQTVKAFIPVAIEWNKTHPLGHTNCNSDMDFYLEDIVLRDSNEEDED